MAKKLTKLDAGDRIAYAAKFLKNICAHTGATPKRRGTFVSYDGDYARVHWDDFDFIFQAQQYGEDYAEDAKANGQRVRAENIAKIGSARFASNDL